MSTIPIKIGKYKIIKEVGRGATAIVYLAESPDHQGPLALKHVQLRANDKIKDEAKWNRRLIKLLKAEASVAQRLDHPNIIKIYEAVIEPEEAYVVMEYFPGQSLERFCSFENMLPVHRAIGIVFKCCLALDYAYRQGVVHRDIKPANILMDDNDEVKITDFGLALNINKKVETDSTFIMGVGSPAYMSPEQIKGYPLNQKTDLYSLGVVLFHLLTGRLPFRATNPAQLIYKIINADPPSICQLNPDLPPLMEKVIKKSLEKDLYSRYKNGADFAKDLSAVRYKIVDDNYRPPDTGRFAVLRKMKFFLEFDDVQLWEVLRIASWRTIKEMSTIFVEGGSDDRFGVLIEGELELSVEGRVALTAGPGEIFGELAWMDELEHKHVMTAVAKTKLTYIEINPSALSLATEEVQALFQKAVASVTARRLGDALKRLAVYGESAMEGSAVTTGISGALKLVED